MKTTKKNFKYFEKRVHYWIKELNLQNYDLDIVHEYLTFDGVPCRGACDRNKDARNCIIYLGKDWGNSGINPINNFTLNRTALHEVLELRLFDLIDMIKTRFMDSANINPEKHSIIQILIKNILKEKKIINKKVNKTTKKINKKVNKKSTKKTSKKDKK